MAEAVLELGVAAHLADDAGAEQAGEAGLESLGAGHALEHARREFATDDGGRLAERAGVLVEPVHARDQEGVE